MERMPHGLRAKRTRWRSGSMIAPRTPPRTSHTPRPRFAGSSALQGFALYGLSICNHSEALIRLLEETDRSPPHAENGGGG